MVIEPEPGILIETLSDARRVIDKADADGRFGLHIDIGHAYCTEDHYVDAIAQNLDITRYMHLADIKNGHNLRLGTAAKLREVNVDDLDLSFASHLIMIGSGEQYVYLGRESTLVLYTDDPPSNADIQHISQLTANRTISLYRFSQPTTQSSMRDRLHPEISAYLGSVAGMNMDVLARFEHPLRYLRTAQEGRLRR